MLVKLAVIVGVVAVSEAMTVAERKVMLDAHNSYRSQLALGQLGGLPSASDMNMLFYDAALEDVAQAWIDRCQWQHNPDAKGDFSKISHLASFEYDGGWVGENLYSGGGIPSAGSARNAKLEQAVQLWNDEYQYWSYPSTCQSGKVCGHFTQNAFAATRYVGCAYAECGSSLYVLCNYYNGRYGQIYKSGSPATSCPPDRTPNPSTGLCEGCQDPKATGCSTCSNARGSCDNGAGVTIGGSGSGGGGGGSNTPEPTGATPSPVTSNVTPRPTGATPSPISLANPPSTTTQVAMLPTSSPREGFRYNDKKALLEKLNAFRSEIALGNVANYSAAADMNKLTWDSDLEEVAREIVSSCSSTFSASTASNKLLALKEAEMAASSTNDAENFNLKEPYQVVDFSVDSIYVDPLTRENIFMKTEQMLDRWFNEKRYECVTQPSNGESIRTECHNFMNLINAETRFVGCSFSVCPSGGENYLYSACAFWPDFHSSHEGGYTAGSQDDCPQDKTRSTATGLCEGCNAPDAGMCVNHYQDLYCDAYSAYCTYCSNSLYAEWWLCAGCRQTCGSCSSADFAAPSSCDDGIPVTQATLTPAPITISANAATNEEGAMDGQSATIIIALLIIASLCAVYSAFATYHAFCKDKGVGSVGGGGGGGSALQVHDSMHDADKAAAGNNADYL